MPGNPGMPTPSHSDGAVVSFWAVPGMPPFNRRGWCVSCGLQSSRSLLYRSLPPFLGVMGQLEEGKVGSLRQKGKYIGGDSVTLALRLNMNVSPSLHIYVYVYNFRC